MNRLRRPALGSYVAPRGGKRAGVEPLVKVNVKRRVRPAQTRVGAVAGAVASEELFRRVPTYQNGSPNTLNGPPTSGAWNVGDFWRDQNRAEFVCTVTGTPGTWRQTMPATVTADPASGTFPIGYLILNVSDGGLKRHAGGQSSEIQVGAGTSSKVGFHGVPPSPQRANVDQAGATDLSSVIVLVNELRSALIEKGLIKGEP